ncbi:MAG: serine/threonine protein kinase [Anaerolineales bacterium]
MHLTGNVLQNRYRIVSLLGQGGMGAVYRTWDTRLSIAVALKEMIPQPGIEPALLSDLQKQFQQEAVVLARLHHPHLVRVTDYFQEEGKVYLAMDFVDGESLADKIEREGAQPQEQVVAWGKELLDALAYCHNQGIIHRDIKPQNVICRPDSSVVLVDFGLVKLWNPQDPQTRTVMRGMGTPEYAPPEQYDLQESHTDPRSDLYSLGATLYHALTGRVPPTATLRMAKPEAYKSPRAIKQSISPALEAAINRAMALPVQDRFSNAAMMAEMLTTRDWSPTVKAPYQGVPSLSHTVPMPESELPPYPGDQPARRSAPPAASPPPPKQRKRKGLPLWGWLAGVGALLLVLALICGGTLLLPDLLGEGRTTPTPRSSGPLSGASFEIRLENRTSDNICYVYISPTNSESWGDDWLGSDEIIQPGTTQIFEVEAVTQDVQLLNCDRITIHTAWELTEDATIVVGEAGTVPLHLKNNSTRDVCYIYISPNTSDSWGEDRLGPRASLRAAEGERIFFIPAGTYDLMALDCDQNQLVEERNVDIRRETTWTIAQ